MTRASEFYAMDPEELENRLVESRRELLNLRFQLATGQLDNVAQIKTIRRDVARVMTVLRAIEIAEAEGITFEAPAPNPERVRAQRRDAEAGVRALEDEEIDVQDDEEPAPARRPRRARAVVTEVEEVEEAEEVEAPKPRARRTPKEAAEETTEVEEAEPAPKRSRTRRTPKAAAEETTEVEEAEPAPKRARVRRTRKAADAADEEQ
jgi:large subunit ribosomal protein L29